MLQHTLPCYAAKSTFMHLLPLQPTIKPRFVINIAINTIVRLPPASQQLPFPPPVAVFFSRWVALCCADTFVFQLPFACM